ncbi:MAG: TetR/AcrR family transcriptional regulator [Chloroflexi bacterium]|nr:TetR/AcrR family transcriptional regulator [Chloroflexota bacterium]
MEKIDRRVLRTRALLRDALIALILERGYDELTIQDITNKADLRRATFYLHYRDKEELLLATLAESFNTLVREMESLIGSDALAGKTQLAAFLITFRHAEAQHRLYSVILNGQSGVVVAQHIREYLVRLLLGALHNTPPEQLALPAEVLAQYIAGAELALLTWWLNAGMPYSAQQMAEMTQRLILHGVADVLPLPKNTP